MFKKKEKTVNNETVSTEDFDVIYLQSTYGYKYDFLREIIDSSPSVVHEVLKKNLWSDNPNYNYSYKTENFTYSKFEKEYFILPRVDFGKETDIMSMSDLRNIFTEILDLYSQTGWPAFHHRNDRDTHELYYRHLFPLEYSNFNFGKSNDEKSEDYEYKINSDFYIILEATEEDMKKWYYFEKGELKQYEPTDLIDFNIAMNHIDLTNEYSIRRLIKMRDILVEEINKVNVLKKDLKNAFKCMQ